MSDFNINILVIFKKFMFEKEKKCGKTFPVSVKKW